jgi:peroxiredoxin
MARGHGHSIWIGATVVALVLFLNVLCGCKRREPAAANAAPADGGKAVPTALQEPTKSPIAAAASLFREPRASIRSIVTAASDRWSPACEPWWGKPAPDFTLTDIEGQTHKLSDYRGKDVVVVFWTTWYGTCKKEVSQWKELRNTYPRENLAILAISSEPTALVKKSAEEQGINYAVLTSSGNLPTPFDKVETVPSSFFVDPDGNFKVAINGMVPVADAKAIVQAQ